MGVTDEGIKSQTELAAQFHSDKVRFRRNPPEVRTVAAVRRRDLDGARGARLGPDAPCHYLGAGHTGCGFVNKPCAGHSSRITCDDVCQRAANVDPQTHVHPAAVGFATLENTL